MPDSFARLSHWFFYRLDRLLAPIVLEPTGNCSQCYQWELLEGGLCFGCQTDSRTRDLGDRPVPGRGAKTRQ